MVIDRVADAEKVLQDRERKMTVCENTLQDKEK